MLAYFDIFVGISGDMTLGALVDAGLPIDVLHDTVDALGLAGEVGITAEQARKGVLAGTKVSVIQRQPDVPHRRLQDILDMIDGAALPASVKEKASDIFVRLGEAEAHVHGVPADEVHFHEVGALDAIVDIVGAVAGLHELGVTRVVASPVPLARGVVNTAHGAIPVPGPATAELLIGVPVRGLDLDVETVTPTGAALISTLAGEFGPVPAMALERVGYGAGSFDLPLPNMLRLLLGTPTDTTAFTGLRRDTLSVLSTNVDDMPGEWFGPLFDDLLEAGALDVWFTPVQMKKGRPAVMISVLAEPSEVPALRLILLRETTTLGVREETVTRWSVPRETRTVQTPWGEIRVKVAHLPDGREKVSPEFEDCRRLAQQHQVPLRDVFQAAMQAATVSA